MSLSVSVCGYVLRCGAYQPVGDDALLLLLLLLLHRIVTGVTDRSVSW